MCQHYHIGAHGALVFLKENEMKNENNNKEDQNHVHDMLASFKLTNPNAPILYVRNHREIEGSGDFERVIPNANEHIMLDIDIRHDNVKMILSS